MIEIVCRDCGRQLGCVLSDNKIQVYTCYCTRMYPPEYFVKDTNISKANEYQKQGERDIKKSQETS
jgi:hypothetical protein